MFAFARKIQIDADTERIGAFAHEMRNVLSTATMSFGLLKRGQLAIGGTVGTILDRSLQSLTDRTGLGLGLSISRRSVRANGGERRVRDVPGTGCVFTIDLPRNPSSPRTT